MVCSGCGRENRPGRKFCVGCGRPLAAACPRCGAPSEPDERFCGECGAALGPTGGAEPGTAPAAPLPGAPSLAPVAERRLVTVLFGDLVGFTPFAEERDVEDVRETLSRYFALAKEVIGRYGGTVEKFIGDAVMAVWGAPVAQEDDAERAVRAGLELVATVRTLGPTIQARVGILTGEAAVTLGAAGQGIVAGDLVNTASRLQSVAPTGAVLVGEATVRAADRAIAFEPAGEQSLRGKTTPVPAFRALRVVAELGGRNRREALEPPFVGREEELRLLKDLFHGTGREGRARLVSVVGPTGIGKSRLAWEFSKYADGLVEDTWWHEGHCPAYGDGITFWALGEMIRRRAGLAETDDEATTRSRVGATVREWITDEAERRWIEPALLVLLGVETSPVAPEQLFGAWRTFFEQMTTRGTVALVFEDLHYADAGLLDFIDHLLEWSRAFPIFVLTLARPELLDRRPDWGAGKRNFTSVYLEPLPESAMRELLGGLVPGLPEEVVRSIVARADGVPLYAVETVRMLLDDGKLATEDGAYRPVGDFGDLAVPETLTELIAARLDALEAADRSLVADAAVLGQSFTTAALAAVSGQPVEALEPRLRGLVRRELFTLVADPRSPERGQHAFVQSLVREVAYNTLARRDRKTRHLAAARYFESLGSDELAGALAAHYLAAYRNAPAGAEADALAIQARVTLKGAATRAASLGSHDQAVVFAEQALAVASDPVEEAECLELAGTSAAAAAHHDQAEAFLRRAIEIRRERGEPGPTARAIAALGSALLPFKTEEALAILEPAAAELADLAADPGVVVLHGQLARARALADDFGRALAVADRVLEAGERLDLVPLVADTLVTKGSALVFVGRGYEGMATIEAGQRLAEANGLETIAFRALINRSTFLVDDDPRAALELSQAAVAMGRRLGQRYGIVLALDNVAWAAMSTGDWDRVTADLDAVLAEDLAPADRIVALGDRYMFLACQGEPRADALARMDALLADAPISGQFAVAIRDWCRAWEALAGGRPDEASAICRRIGRQSLVQGSFGPQLAARAALWGRDAEGARADLDALENLGLHGRRARAIRSAFRAGIAALEGRRGEALALYREALGAWRDLDLPWDEALTAIDMATLLDPADPEVRAAADRAHEILTRLRARPFLERLEAAMARTSVGGVGS